MKSLSEPSPPVKPPTPNDLRLERLKREQKRRKAQSKLLDFTEYTKRNYVTNWHHSYLCQTLERWIHGDLDRLMVFMPPRHGKSELVSRRLPAYLFGLYPECEIIAASYSARLAQKMSRDTQRIMQDPSYQRVFPRTTLGGKGSILTADEFDIDGSGGGYICSGIGGGITGRGMDFGIIDDPIKGHADAYSPTFRDKTYDWYQDVFYTRAEGNAKILITLTRWHEDDLAGRLLADAASNPDADQWETVCFPMVATEEQQKGDPRQEGEVLWPWKYSPEKVRKMRATLVARNPRTWSSLYQQTPRIEGGGSIKREWFRYYTCEGDWATLQDGRVIDTAKALRFATMDCAFTTKNASDYSVLSIWALHREKDKPYDLILLDRYRVKKEVPDLIPLIKGAQTKWGTAQSIIEGNSGGKAVVQYAIKAGVRVREYTATKDKNVRVSMAQPVLERGGVHFPSDAPWLSEWEDECLGFPNALHDDQVDSMTMAIELIEEGKLGASTSAHVAVTGTPRINDLGAPLVGVPPPEKRNARSKRSRPERPKW